MTRQIPLALLLLFASACSDGGSSTALDAMTADVVATDVAAPDAAAADIGTRPDVPEEPGPSWLVSDEVPPAVPPADLRANGPEDWRDEVIYFVLTDRFANGDTENDETRRKDDGTPLHDPTNIMRYHGGDFAGILAHLDYLRVLGATTLWVTPIVENVREDAGRCGYAGYWAHDLTKVDPHLLSSVPETDTAAGRAAYRDFADTLHENGILLVQDIVVNHMGNLSLYTLEGEEQWDPAFRSTCYGEESHLFIDGSSHAEEIWVEYGLRTRPPAPFDDPAFYNNCGRSDTDPKGDLTGLDDLATERPEVRSALTAVYADWIRDARIDGFRIDTVKHVEDGFYDEFAPAMRAVVAEEAPGKRFFQFGEAYVQNHAQMARFVEGERLDALLNFELYYAMQAVFVKGEGTARLTTELANRASNLRATEIPGPAGAGLGAGDAAVNFLDNHDVARFLDAPGATVQRLWVALAYLMTTKGIPCLYYNTENAVKGVAGSGEGGRVDMPDFATTGKKTFTLLRKLAEVRRANIALRRGDLTVLADAATPGVFAFARETGTADETVIVVLNTSDAPLTTSVDLQGTVADGARLTNALAGAFGVEDGVDVSAGTISVTLEPLDAKVLTL